MEDQQLLGFLGSGSQNVPTGNKPSRWSGPVPEIRRGLQSCGDDRARPLIHHQHKEGVKAVIDRCGFLVTVAKDVSHHLGHLQGTEVRGVLPLLCLGLPCLSLCQD